MSTAVRFTTFGTMTAAQYEAFATAYGHDVLACPATRFFETSANSASRRTQRSAPAKNRYSGPRRHCESRVSEVHADGVLGPNGSRWQRETARV